MSTRLHRMLLVCAVCAVALISAPRMALAQLVEIDMGVNGYTRFNTSVSGGRTILTNQTFINTLSFINGGFTTYPTTSTNTISYINLREFGDVGYYVARSAYSTAGGSLPMNTYPQIAYIFDCYNLNLTDNYLRLTVPRTINWYYLPLYSSTSVSSYGTISVSTNWWYYLPHGADRSVASNWVPLTVSSDGWYKPNTNIDAIGCIISSNVTLQDSPVVFSQMDPNDLFFGSSNMPHVYINFPELSDAATSEDVAAAAQSINGSISSQTSSINSSISSQTTSINSNIDTEVQGQTNTLMDTTGSDSILSHQVSNAQQNLEVGVFGQLSGIAESITGVLVDSNRDSTIYFPGVNVMGYQLIAPQDVDIWQGGLSQFQEPVRAICTFILVCYWLNGMFKLFWKQLLGYSFDDFADRWGQK